MQDAGINPLEEMTILRSSNRGFEMLQESKVDATVKSSNSYERTLDQDGFNAREYPILARGEVLPSDIFVASGYLSEAFVTEMHDRFLENSPRLIAAIHSTSDSFAQRFRNSQFVSADDANYKMIRDIYRLLGEDEFL